MQGDDHDYEPVPLKIVGELVCFTKEDYAHALDAARAEERERCAKLSEEFTGEFPPRDQLVGRIIAHNIRSLPISK